MTQLEITQINLLGGDSLEPFAQQPGIAGERFQTGVIEFDQLSDVLVTTHKLGQTLAENHQLITSFAVFRALNICVLHVLITLFGMRFLPSLLPLIYCVVKGLQLAIEAVSCRLRQREQLLMRHLGVNNRIPKRFYLSLFVDEHTVQTLLDVVDDVRVLNVRHLGITVEGLERRQNLLGLVGEINDEGLVLAWEGAIEARERLHGFNTGYLLV